MLGRKEPSPAAPQGPAHEQNAAAARALINTRDVAGKPLEMRYQALLRANALATLAVYELLHEQGHACR